MQWFWTARDPLHIAMIAPPWFTVPPHGYGGVENVCADLVHGLMDRGHAVTLIGAGASGTPARVRRDVRRAAERAAR